MCIDKNYSNYKKNSFMVELNNVAILLPMIYA